MCFEEGLSFQECIRKYAETIFIDLIGCIPPWFTGDKETMCGHSFTKVEYENISNIVRYIAYEEHFKGLCLGLSLLDIFDFLARAGRYAHAQSCRLCKT